MKLPCATRHIVVDTLGLMVGLVVHSADIQDRDGASVDLRPFSNTGLGSDISSPMAAMVDQS